MRFAVTGSTGFIGTELIRRFRLDGHDVTRIVRSRADVQHDERAAVWHPDRGVVEAGAIEGHDVAVHLAGENIAGLWTRAKKGRIRESREIGTRLIAETLAGLERPPRVFLSASAFGIYGDRGDQPVDEDSAIGEGFLPEVAAAWEAATRPASDAGIRVVHMRFGNVLGRHGGMLKAMLPVFKLGMGTKFGDGSQYWPWIAIGEIAPAILHVIDRPEMTGPVNFVAPQPVTNAEFTDTLAAALHRPSFLRIPAFAARLAPGGMGDELLLFGARVVPRRLLETGYSFREPDLQAVLLRAAGGGV